MTETAELADPVSISYADLKERPESLSESIEKAFGSGSDCLGIVVVNGLPSQYATLRKRLLLLANDFASLDDNTREKYANPETNYSFGWSFGKEIMNGVPDYFKGSYYANPVTDHPQVSPEARKEHPEVYNDNIWPSESERGIEGFEDAFKDLGKFVFETGCILAQACQPFASSLLKVQDAALPEMLQKSQTLKARLLHYFPPPPDAKSTNDDDWCGWHLDHSMLTGLCSAMYLDHSSGKPLIVPSPSKETGLYIRTRAGKLCKVAIPEGALAFQTGEALQVATDGRLRATPHCVRVGSSTESSKISRETFALFMAPETDQRISDSDTYGTFSKRIISGHYEAPPAVAAN